MTLILILAAFAAGIVVARKYPTQIDRVIARVRSIRE